MSRDHEAADPTFDAEAFRRGDPECFRLLLRRFGPLIRSIAASYAQDGDDRDEPYQTVSIRLLTQRGHYEDWGAVRGWVTRLAHNCCRNWFAARKARESAHDRYAARAIPAEESGDILDDPARLLDYRSFLDSLERALAALPEQQAEAFRLVHIEGRTPSAAARRMRVSAATVRSHLRHARIQLRELLQEEKDALS